MDYREQFTDEQLTTIIEQGLIYMCACPAQVADRVRKLRETYRYQRQCMNDPETDTEVHRVIANRVAAAHEILENCLEEVIALEKWDCETLQMPPHLRKRQAKALLDDGP